MDLPLIRFKILEPFPKAVCASSTRRGGVSGPPFESLNMGFSRGDVRESVRENRRRFLQALGIPPAEVVVGQQVHGAHVQAVGRRDRGRGAMDPSTGIQESDGLVTVEPGVFLLSVSADCPLVGILAPPDLGVALAHCGWRGVAAGMPAEAVAALGRATGAPARDMLAVIGPAIGPCCYEVGGEVLERLSPSARRAARIDGGREAGAPPGGEAGTSVRYRLDLHLAIRLLLEESGLSPDRIEASQLCSSCEEGRFFSHRRDGATTGRIAMAMGIREIS